MNEEYENCKLCNKPKKKLQSVWYSFDIETEICWGCYLKWSKSNKCKELEKKYADAEPCTKEWHKRCVSLQKAFNKWLKEGEKEK